MARHWHVTQTNGKPKGYWHTLQLGGDGRWREIVGSSGSAQFSLGYYTAVSDMMPRPALRLIDQHGRVRQERGASRRPSP